MIVVRGGVGNQLWPPLLKSTVITRWGGDPRAHHCDLYKKNEKTTTNCAWFYLLKALYDMYYTFGRGPFDKDGAKETGMEFLRL